MGTTKAGFTNMRLACNRALNRISYLQSQPGMEAYEIIELYLFATELPMSRMPFLQLIGYVKLSLRRFYFPVISFYDEIVSVVDGFHTGFW